MTIPSDKKNIDCEQISDWKIRKIEKLKKLKELNYKHHVNRFYKLFKEQVIKQNK